jgi:hypothetical protein
MPIVKLTLNIDMLKMEKTFFTGYRKGERVFCISSTNWKGDEEKECTYIDTWSSIWKEKNAEFEKFLAEDSSFCWLSVIIFHV